MPTTSIEREIKLRFASARDARAAVVAAGATPAAGRRFQDDALFDTDGEDLGHRRCALRLRRDGPRSVVTFKGPVQPGPMKLREELESSVADGAVLQQILERLPLPAVGARPPLVDRAGGEDPLQDVREQDPRRSPAGVNPKG